MRWWHIAVPLAVSLLACLADRPAIAREVVIEHVTVVSPNRTAPLWDATVSIQNDRIVSVAPGPSVARSSRADQTIDATGLYLTPGLIDSHVHSNLPGIEAPQKQKRPDVARAMREQLPRSYLYYGFTTLIDLISTPERLRDWTARDPHPDVYFCGAAPIPGGYPRDYPLSYSSPAEQARQYPYMLIERGKEKEAPEGVAPAAHTPEAVVARMKADGAICVKTFYERGFTETDQWPVPRLDTIRALVAAAHAAHMPVFIHANGTDAQEFAVKAGADVIAHGMWHWNGEQQATELTPRAKGVLDSVLKAKMGWQPTMQVLYGLRDLFDPNYLADARLKFVVPPIVLDWYGSSDGKGFRDLLVANRMAVFDPLIARNVASVGYMATHGARLLFGTDTPSAPTYANPPGLNEMMEMERLVAAGVTSEQIFRAATSSNAAALGLAREIGSVAPGKRANLLLMRADPTQSIRAYETITQVILRGRVIERSSLAAAQ
jgi:imidazolonepropionase-like amidohydrolase